MIRANDIRSSFIDYFSGHDHEPVASGPLVPANDPSLLFTNAGMVQFKNVFTGAESRPYERAVTAQKCVRAGGKHNDLENVGHTTRHHTFFEMLGNFSFGDYFKDVAIDHAWKLITREWGVNTDRLLVTVFADDEEAATLWKKVSGLPDSRILRISTSDNFWTMGDTGPCGPCTEIFYDLGESIAGGPPGTAEEDGDRFMEFWNLVFMQFEQVDGDTRVDLPRPSVDTGMGLERIANILQGKHDNYDTDLFRPLIESTADLVDADPDGARRASLRAIADHVRASSFLIADGVLPSNEGRGYVLRRIMRRAMRHAHLLGARDPLLWRLVSLLESLMGQAYPELTRAQAMIEETLRSEENRFREMLERGLRLLAEETGRLSGTAALPGEVAFRLYDTFGFPLDLTQDVLRGEGREVEISGFDAAMDRQRAEARRAWTGSGDAATEHVWFALRERVGTSKFLGYAATEDEGMVQAIVRDGVEQESATAGETVAIICNQSPFYGESGGQLGDTGVIFAGIGQQVQGALRLQVTDTLKRADTLIVHQAKVEAGEIRSGDRVLLQVDDERRAKLRRNHSVTHLLHAVLRQTLGHHVAQRGSLVAPDRLRFDFSQPGPVTDDALSMIEEAVNRRIRMNSVVDTRVMSQDEALALGAVALFGEKYGDEVRVVSMGGPAERPTPDDGAAGDSQALSAFSLEFCGGTHVGRTGDIGTFRIVSESAVGAGVRRIEALTGEAARRWDRDQRALLNEAVAVLRVPPADVPERLRALLDERRQLERSLMDVRRQMASGGTAEPESRTVNGVRFAARTLSDVSPRELKSMADSVKLRLGSGVVAIVTTNEDRASLVVAVTDDLTDRFNAVTLVRIGADALGGKGGGGRPDMAQAGGPDCGQASAALAAIESALGAAEDAI